MNYRYDFESEVNIIRALFAREHHIYDPYAKPSTRQVQAVVIAMEAILKQLGFTSNVERREIRLAILSFLTKQEITTTYDLSAHQCSVLIGQLFTDEEGNFATGERTRRFLEDCANATEGSNISGKVNNDDTARKTRDDTEMRILRELGY